VKTSAIAEKILEQTLNLLGEEKSSERKKKRSPES
jgi:hypothetical protein